MSGVAGGILLLAVIVSAQLSPSSQSTDVARLFRDLTREAGLTFQHRSAPDKKFIVESMSGGVAMVDIDGDGLLDIYLIDSPTVESAHDANAARSVLYRNLGGGRFEDVTDRAGVGDAGWGMGVCGADVDGDRRVDLYVTALGRNRLFHNNGDGTFTDIAERSGLAAGGWSTGCGFADYDRDGLVDLFVSRYVSIDLDHLPEFGKDKTCRYLGLAVQCGPRGLPGQSDLLFHNLGNGRFAEVAATAGVSDPKGYFGLGIAWFDSNVDGWPDLFVANDSTPNFLYINQRNGTFTEVGFAAGVAVDEEGKNQGSMGVAIGDYDNSGRPSIFVTNFADEYNALYHNDGGRFTDVSFRSKTAPSSLPYVGWGAAFFDYDNDSWLDLIAVNGHVYPQLEAAKAGASAGYRQRTLLYHNRGDGTFDETAAQFGAALMAPRVNRGLAVGDMDNDGRLDVIVNALDGSPQLLRNEHPSGNWLMVALEGRAPHTDALGAVVTLTSRGRRQMRTVQSGSSYLSQSDTRLHFGLGPASGADAVEVRWPDGTRTAQETVAGNRIVRIRQAQ